MVPKHLRKCCQAFNFRLMKCCPWCRKKQQIVDKASFFLWLRFCALLFSVPPQPPGMGTRLGDNHNIGKIKGTRVTSVEVTVQDGYICSESWAMAAVPEFWENFDLAEVTLKTQWVAPAATEVQAHPVSWNCDTSMGVEWWRRRVASMATSGGCVEWHRTASKDGGFGVE